MSQPEPLLALIKDDPFSDRPPRLIEASPGESVADLVDRAGFSPLAREHVEVMIDGVPVEAELWAPTRVPACGHVQAVVMPQGGGDGSKLLRTVLTLAVIVGAFYLGAPVATQLGLTFEGAAGLVTAVISTIGSLAINAILPPPQFDSLPGPDPVYFIEGARNRLAPGQPIQTVLGTHRVVPRLAGRPYPEIRGDDTYYYMIFDYGPIGVAVSDRKIGDTPISALEGVVYQERLVASDPHPTMASRQVIADTVGATLSTASWDGRRTAADSIDCDLILSFPEGLGKVSKKGKRESNSIILRVRYREVINPGPGETFGPWTFASVRQNTAFPAFRGFNFFTGFEGVQYTPETAENGMFTFTETKPAQPFFRQIGFSFPTAGTYDVEIQRATTDRTEDRVFDDVVLQTVLSKRDEPAVTRDDVAYGVYRFKGTDETSGPIDEFNALMSRLVPGFSDAVLDQPDLSGMSAADLSAPAPSSRGAEQILWALRNGFEGRLPVADSAIDWPSFAAAAKDARDRGLAFDTVIEREIEIGALVDMIARNGCEGRVYSYNNIFTLALDRAIPAPAHVFRDGTARNISLIKSFPPDVHAFKVEFNDAANGYRTTPVTIYVDGHTPATAQRFETLQLPGKTDWDDLHGRVAQLWRNSRLQNERLSCEVPIDAVDNTLRPMSRVSVATRVIEEVSAGGVLRAITTNAGNVTAVELDQEVDAGPATGALALKWVRTPTGETATLSVPIDLVTPATDGRVTSLQLVTPVAIAAGPQAGDEFVIGPAGTEFYEGLLASAEQAGEDWLRLDLRAYAPARFDETGFTVPAYAAQPVLPLGTQPPTPIYSGASVSEREVTVSFTLAEGYEGTLRELRVWRAFAPPTTDPEPNTLSAFEQRPSLDPNARQLVDVPGSVDDRVVYRIAAVSDSGRVGTVMQTPIITVADLLTPLTGLVVVAGSEVGAGNVIKPVILVTFTPETDLALDSLVIETRRVALDGGGARLPEGSQPAFEEEARISPQIGAYTVRGLAGGSTYDVRAWFLGARGEIGAALLAQDVLLPDDSPGNIDAGDVTNLGALALLDQIGETEIADGSISTPKLKAASVDASRLNVATLSAISANLGNVNSGSLSINNKFIVDAAGNVTIRSATTGQRLTISNSVLEVFDANNVRRVRLGIW